MVFRFDRLGTPHKIRTFARQPWCHWQGDNICIGYQASSGGRLLIDAAIVGPGADDTAEQGYGHKLLIQGYGTEGCSPHCTARVGCQRAMPWL